MSRRLLWVSVLVGSALSFAAAWATVTHRLIVGSAEGGWAYQYLEHVDSGAFAPVLLVIAFAAVASAAAWPQVSRLVRRARPGPTGVGEWAVMIGMCLLAAVLQGLVRSPNPFPVGSIFASDTANAFYSVAAKHDVRRVLGDFEQLRAAWPVHARSNMPGKILLVHALMQISTRADVQAWLIVVISNLGGLLLYAFVRDLSADRLIAGLSVVLYLLTPAKLFFFPLLNTVTPVVVLACGYLLLRWLHGGRVRYAVLLGIAVYGLVLFEPTALIVGVLFAALIARALRRGDISVRTVLLQGATGVAAFALTQAAMVVWFGFDLIATLRHIAADAAAFNMASNRPYALWVRQNIFDFLYGVGCCQVVLFWAALGDGVAGATSRRDESGWIVVLCLSILAMVGLADVIGVNRGEVIRLWIFLACLWQIPAAYVCARLDSRAAFMLVLITTLLQDALGSAMIGFIVPG